jgi:hypothetical protein
MGDFCAYYEEKEGNSVVLVFSFVIMAFIFSLKCWLQLVLLRVSYPTQMQSINYVVFAGREAFQWVNVASVKYSRVL